MAEAKGKATSCNMKGYYQHILLGRAKGTSTGGSLRPTNPPGTCHSPKRLSQDVTAKVTKDKGQPVESPQLMRAENRLKYPDDLTDGDVDLRWLQEASFLSDSPLRSFVEM